MPCEPRQDTSCDQESIPITASIPTPPLVSQDSVPIPASVSEPFQSGDSDIPDCVDMLPGNTKLPKRGRGRPSKAQ